MSEYQCYQFFSCDRPLTESDRDYLQNLSSRVQVGSNRAEFVYNYSDFRGDPLETLARCFDIMVYIANFGTRRIAIRLPKEAIDLKAWRPYFDSDAIEHKTVNNNLILDITTNDDDGHGWISDGVDWISPLVPLREELLQGDRRLLYLGWLMAWFSESAGLAAEEPEDRPEPPVPPNLQKLSPALQAAADFLLIDDDLIEAAATASPEREVEAEPLEEWVATLSAADCRAYLLRAMRGETYVGREVLQRLRQEFSAVDPADGAATGRTMADLLAASQAVAAAREQREKEARKRQRQKQLQAIADRQADLWAEVPPLVAGKRANTYDAAVKILCDLRDLAKFQKQEAEFQTKLQQLVEEYGRLAGFMSRLKRANLL